MLDLRIGDSALTDGGVLRRQRHSPRTSRAGEIKYDQDDEHTKDEENYEFLRRLSENEKSDLSAAVREPVYKGRIMVAVELYRQRKASLGRAAELAGVPLGEIIEVLANYGVESNLEVEDYRKGLEHLRKVW